MRGGSRTVLVLNCGAGAKLKIVRRAHRDRVDLIQIVVCGTDRKAEPAGEGGVWAAYDVVLGVRLEGAVVVIVVQRHVPLAWLQTFGEDDDLRSFRRELEKVYGTVNALLAERPVIRAIRTTGFGISNKEDWQEIRNDDGLVYPRVPLDSGNGESM